MSNIQKRSSSTNIIKSQGKVDTQVVMEQIKEIRNNNDLSVLDKRKLIKQIVRGFHEARGDEIEQTIDLYYKTLIARKDVAEKSITLDAQKDLSQLDQEHTKVLGQMGIQIHGAISDLFNELGEITTKKLKELMEREINDDLREILYEGIMNSFRKTYKKIEDGLDTYIEELKEKELLRKK